MPPAATLVYALQRGAVHGTADLRWQPRADGYTLDLEARVGAAVIIEQRSTGGFDAAGLAPLRHTDRRRRQWQATSFQREAGKVSFSATPAEFVLAPGTQDRLTWMLQLAAILAARPVRPTSGDSVAITVAGLRGAPEIWVFRCGGDETLAVGGAETSASRWLREGLGAYDSRAEVWLDPQRHYLPLQVFLGSASAPRALELRLHDFSTPP